MDAVTLSKNEFLLDDASYFEDKKDLYWCIKRDISRTLSVDVSDIRICGSAYWGLRFVDETPFQPGSSDLDVAIINPSMFCRCMTEVRELTKNFNDQSVFPQCGNEVNSFDLFRGYAFGKGIIMIHHLPDIQIRRDLSDASQSISKRYLDHFEKITFSIYDSAISFAVKQAQATKKFRG